MAKSSNEVSLSITAAVEVLEGEDAPEKEVDVLISVNTAEGNGRLPLDIVCVLDISGSMGMGAVTPAGLPGNGMTVLDVAKHGVRTMFTMLQAEDRFSLVVFNHLAEVVLPLTAMDEDSRKEAGEKLDAIMQRGGTNIWEGLHVALEALREGAASHGPKRLAHVMLLTDGASVERDLVLTRLTDYKLNHEELNAIINTFGLGYSVDSRLLTSLALFGNGSCSFIPDVGFVGTCFCNVFSNIFVTFAYDAYLCLEPEEDVEIRSVLGGYKNDELSWGSRLSLGTLQHGQSRDVVIRCSNVKSGLYLGASLEYMSVSGGGLCKVDIVDGPTVFDAEAVSRHLCRAKLVDLLDGFRDTIKPSQEYAGSRGSFSSVIPLVPVRQPIDDSLVDRLLRCFRPAHICKSPEVTESPPSFLQPVPLRRVGSMECVSATDATASLAGARSMLQRLIEEVSTSAAKQNPCVQALLEDMRTQVSEALMKEEWYWKWGLHYTQSLMFAHKLQQCNNFKDPGVQSYGGKHFRQLRDEADEQFNILPPPVPRRMSCSYGSPINMAMYNDASAGCIAGSSTVSLFDGKQRRISDLKKGDCVLGLGGEAVDVLCAVRMSCKDGQAVLCDVGGALLTPYHPILIGDMWCFPLDHAKPQVLPCDAVYNFLLRGRSSCSLLVGKTLCVGLGHGIEQGAAQHPYFGSFHHVMKDIKRFPGFDEGLVELSPDCVCRDCVSGLVSGLRSMQA